MSVGANVLALRPMFGHHSAKVTLDVYADLFDSDLDELAARLDAAYALKIVGNRGHGEREPLESGRKSTANQRGC